MSLLDNNDDFEFEPQALVRTNTEEPLFDSADDEDQSATLQIHRPKKKGKVVDDKKGSALSLGRRKAKDSVTEKNPKRKRTKSFSRSPPESPKSSRAVSEARKGSKATVTPLQPSPNVKSTRRRYSQFQGTSSSEDEGEDGTLLSNRAATDQDKMKGSAETSPHHSIPTTPEPVEAAPLKRSPSPRQLSLPFPISFSAQFSPEKAKSGAPALLSPAQAPGFFQSPLVPLQAPPVTQAPWHPETMSPWQPEATPTPANDPDWSVSDELRQKCRKQFLELKPIVGLLSGEHARQFFVQSKLPNQQLSLIWRLADVNRDNALSEEEFCIAMKLVVMKRRGFEIPSTLPETLQPKQELFSDDFWPPSSSATQPQALPPPPQGFKQHTPYLSSRSAMELPVPPDFSMNVDKQLLKGQPSAPDLLTPSEEEEEEEKEGQRENLHAADPVLVEIGDTTSRDTGPLVSLEQSSHLEPPTGKIISLEGESEGEEEEEGAEETVLFTAVESPVETEPVRDNIKPARPAPPKPQVRRAKSLKAVKPLKPELPPRPNFDDQKRTANNHNRRKTSPDVELTPSSPSKNAPSLKSAEEYEAVPVISVDKASLSSSSGTRKGSRPTNISPATGRKKYSALASELSTPDASPSEDGNGEGEGVEGSGRFGWQPLRAKEKGHARASSLDLNKVLQSSDSGDVHKDMPSAVPPKPPPKPSIATHQLDSSEQEKSVIRSRVRSASTGSIDVGEFPPDDTHTLDTSTNALLLSPSNRPKPHPRKAPLLPPQAKPRRPAPVKHRMEGESYQPASTSPPPPLPFSSSSSDSKPSTKAEDSGQLPWAELQPHASKEKPSSAAAAAATAVQQIAVAPARDKVDMQMNIRSLKENNAALTEINKTLEEKLFKLMEDRVMLDRELELANQLLQHQLLLQQSQQQQEEQ